MGAGQGGEWCGSEGMWMWYLCGLESVWSGEFVWTCEREEVGRPVQSLPPGIQGDEHKPSLDKGSHRGS